MDAEPATGQFLAPLGFVVQLLIMFELLRIPAKIAPYINCSKRGSLLKANVAYHIKTTSGRRQGSIYRKLWPSGEVFDQDFSSVVAPHCAGRPDLTDVFRSCSKIGGAGRTRWCLQGGPGSVCNSPLGRALQVVPSLPRRASFFPEGARCGLLLGVSGRGRVASARRGAEVSREDI